MRVGPRAISSVLPAVHASCGTISRSTREILEALPAREPAQVLAAFITPRIQELDRTLTSAVPKPMYAKNRLRLETVVKRIAADLDAARSLVDLLSDAAWGASLRVDLVELAREATKKEDRAETAFSRRISVNLHLPGSPNEVLVNPLVVVRALGFAAALVARARPLGRPSVVVRHPVEGPSVLVDAEERAGDVAELAIPALIEPTVPMVVAALAMTDSQFRWEESSSRVLLSWTG